MSNGKQPPQSTQQSGAAQTGGTGGQKGAAPTPQPQQKKRAVQAARAGTKQGAAPKQQKRQPQAPKARSTRSKKKWYTNTVIALCSAGLVIVLIFVVLGLTFYAPSFMRPFQPGQTPQGMPLVPCRAARQLAGGESSENPIPLSGLEKHGTGFVVFPGLKKWVDYPKSILLIKVEQPTDVDAEGKQFRAVVSTGEFGELFFMSCYDFGRLLFHDDAREELRAQLANHKLNEPFRIDYVHNRNITGAKGLLGWRRSDHWDGPTLELELKEPSLWKVRKAPDDWHVFDGFLSSIEPPETTGPGRTR